MKNNKAIRSEMRIIENHLSLWLILRDSKRIGLITARHSRKATIITIRFQDMEVDPNMVASDKSNKGSIVEDYEVMTGAGYDRTNEGIASLLLKSRLELHSNYDIVFTCPDMYMINRWEHEIRNSGCEVLRLL